jgi:hypothetical protein
MQMKVFENVTDAARSELDNPKGAAGPGLRERVRLLLTQHDAASYQLGNSLEGREARGYRRALNDVLNLIKDLERR